ncbi:MAG: hypothetical protein HKP44_13660, partial [Desulfofustis sp.]|nr:hypothetical protein [Desulfofustis sp.]
MNRRIYLTKLVTLLLLTFSVRGFSIAQGQTILSPTDHCRDFSADAIVTFADPDLAEVVHEALGLEPGATLSCGQAAELEQLVVGTTI